jgi:hypothetical protein
VHKPVSLYHPCEASEASLRLYESLRAAKPQPHETYHSVLLPYLAFHLGTQLVEESLLGLSGDLNRGRSALAQLDLTNLGEDGRNELEDHAFEDMNGQST